MWQNEEIRLLVYGIPAASIRPVFTFPPYRDGETPYHIIKINFICTGSVRRESLCSVNCLPHIGDERIKIPVDPRTPKEYDMQRQRRLHTFYVVRNMARRSASKDYSYMMYLSDTSTLNKLNAKEERG